VRLRVKACEVSIDKCVCARARVCVCVCVRAQIQILLASYRDLRTRMHEMYKALRADNAVRLHTDFVKNQKQALAEKELRHDRGLEDSNATFGALKNRAHSGDAAFFDSLCTTTTTAAAAAAATTTTTSTSTSTATDHHHHHQQQQQQQQQPHHQLELLSKKQLAALVSVAAKYGNVSTVHALLRAIERTSSHPVWEVLASFGEG
jgi:hypothetical protein